MPRSHRVNIRVPGAVALEVLQFPSPPHPPGPPIFLAGGPFVGPVAGNQVTVRTKKFLPWPIPSHAPAALVVHAWFPPQDAGPAFQIFPLLITGNTTKVLIQNQPFQPPSPNEAALLAGLLAAGGGVLPGILDQLHTQGSEHASQTGAVHRTPKKTRSARKARVRRARMSRAGRKARYQGVYGQHPHPSHPAHAGARAATNHLFGPGSTYSYGAVSAASAAPVGSVAEVPPNTLTQVSDTIFCKRYPLTCANMQALGHGAYGSQTMDPNLPEFDDTSNGAENGAENDGWFQDEVVEKPMRTAGVLALAGLGIWFLSGRGY